MTLVFMFPGQSSRDPGMIERAIGLSADGVRIVEEASELVGLDLRARCRAADAFATNREVQLAVFVTNHLHLCALRERGVDTPTSLGLSLGEYNHLVHVGALRFADAVRLVDARGRAYDDGPEGAMLVAFPIELADLAEAIERARAHGVLEVVNLNSPTQHVLAGERPAVDAAARILEDELFVAAVRIDDRVPMHSSIFRPAADAFRPALDAARIRPPVHPYLPNALGHRLECPSSDEIRALLYRHVHQPVLFRKSVEHLVANHPDATFLEVGPRAVLYGLLSRRWVSNRRFKTDAEAEPHRALAVTLEEIAHAA